MIDAFTDASQAVMIDSNHKTGAETGLSLSVFVAKAGRRGEEGGGGGFFALHAISEYCPLRATLLGVRKRTLSEDRKDNQPPSSAFSPKLRGTPLPRTCLARRLRVGRTVDMGPKSPSTNLTPIF